MNRFVLAEAAKCIGCHTCEIACDLAHKSPEFKFGSEDFQPRLTLVVHGDVTTPVMCHQCDDAACVKACPNNAIVYAEDSVQLVSERCIGCKSCVVACPFGAMTVVRASPSQAKQGLFPSQHLPARAHKCDLCLHREEGPACIAVCPTHALHMVDETMMEMALQKRRLQDALETPGYAVAVSPSL